MALNEINKDLINYVCKTDPYWCYGDTFIPIPLLQDPDEIDCLVHGYCKNNTASIPTPLAIISLILKFIDEILKGGLTCKNPYPWLCSICCYPNGDAYFSCDSCGQNRPFSDPKHVMKVMQNKNEDYLVKRGKIQVATSPQIRDDKFNLIPLKQLSKYLFLKKYKWRFTFNNTKQWIGMKVGIMCRGISLPCYDGFSKFISAKYGECGLKRLLTAFHVFAIHIKPDRIVQISEVIVDNDSSINDTDIYLIPSSNDDGDGECFIEFTLSHTQIQADVCSLYGHRECKRTVTWNVFPNGKYRAIINQPTWNKGARFTKYNFSQIDQTEIDINDIAEYPLNEFIE